jgi:rRNA maturation RNase YbeY
MAMITFNFQDVKLKLSDRQNLRRWISSETLALGYKTGDINYVFCNDEFLSDLNIKYLSHKTLTDIITFDYSEGKRIVGDIFISIERVAENAKKFDKLFHDELHRVMIHGILHLAGFNDKSDKDKMEMRNQEDKCLENYKMKTKIN